MAEEVKKLGHRHFDWDPNTLTITQAPAPREAYWIGVFEDAVEPEFTGYHPGVII
jgi:hypothetical protein